MSEGRVVLQRPEKLSKRPSVGLHLLVKNGESVVGRLLDCVGPYLTEVAPVLNDCEDRTLDVLLDGSRAHGLRLEAHVVTSATHPSLYLLDVPETYAAGRALAGEVLDLVHTGKPLLANFSAAREVGWSRHQSRWRLFLDADDVVLDPECLPGLCAELDARGIVAASSRYLYRRSTSGASFASAFRERLARNLPDITWRGRIHEHLAGHSPGEAAHVDGNLVVRDLRDSRGAGTRDPGRNFKVLYHQARVLLDWRLLPRETAYLAAEARAVGLRSLAMCLAERYLSEFSGRPEEAAWICSIAGEACEDEEEWSLASAWHERSLATFPGYAAALRLARTRFFEGRHEDAVAAFEAAQRLGQQVPLLDGGESVVDEISILAAISMSRVGRAAEALELCREARRKYPGESSLAVMEQVLESDVRAAEDVAPRGGS